MRLFIAIHLSQEIKETLIDLQNEWYDLGVRGNYSSEENLHLTLAFIGEYPDPDIRADSAAIGGRWRVWRFVVGRRDAFFRARSGGKANQTRSGGKTHSV